MRANALAVMAKAPRPGQVKTRLFPALGAEQAAQLARALLLDQLEHLTGLGDVDLYLAFTPATERALFEELAPSTFELFPQEGEDLGARMANALAYLHGTGHRGSILIGGDLAPVPLENFAQAFVWLDHPLPRVVLGPSQDGGYYLVGSNHPTPDLFRGMTWSHSAVLQRTLVKLDSLAVEVHLLAPWFDIDTPRDLDDLRSKHLPVLEASMKNTLGWLSRAGLNRP